MYCSACGSEASVGLSYCKHCGAKLGGNRETGEAPHPPALSLVFAIAATFIFGLGAIGFLMMVMKEVLKPNDGLIYFFTLLSFLLLIITEGVFVRLLLRGSQPRRKRKAVREEEHITGNIGGDGLRALPEPMASITEHTTRNIEPILKDRDA